MIKNNTSYFTTLLIVIVILTGSILLAGCHITDKSDKHIVTGDVETVEINAELPKVQFGNNKYKTFTKDVHFRKVFVKDLTSGKELLLFDFGEENVMYSQYINENKDHITGNLYVAKENEFKTWNNNYDIYELWKYNTDNGKGERIYTHKDDKYFQFAVSKDEKLIAIKSDIKGKTYIINNQEGYTFDNIEEKAMQVIEPIDTEHKGFTVDLVTWNDDNSALWMEIGFQDIWSLYRVTLNPFFIKEYAFDASNGTAIPMDYKFNPNTGKILYSVCMRPQDPPSQEEIDNSTGTLYLYDIETNENTFVDLVKSWHCYEDAKWLNDSTFVYDRMGQIIEYDIELKTKRVIHST